jgi:hypothetical protein
MDPVTPRSRRAVLAGALSGVAAAVASSLVRPSTVGAATGDPLTLGTGNVATSNTSISTSSSLGVTTMSLVASGTGAALFASSNDGRGVSAATQGGQAIRAAAGSGGFGVYSTSATGVSIMGISGTVFPSGSFGAVGVVGFKSDGTGVWASSTTGIALRATSGGQAASFSSSSIDVPSLVSKSSGGKIGVVGLGGNFTPATYPDGVGVFGENPDVSGIGVYGRTANGTAILGDSGTGYGLEAYGAVGVYASGGAVGVIGDVDQATGVQGWTGVAVAPDSGDNVGVWAGAENGRTALKVQGVVRMNRSGRVSMGSTKSSVVVTVPGGIASTSLGFATLQTNRAGYYVQAVVNNTATSQITIYLNKALTTATYVSWLVIG